MSLLIPEIGKRPRDQVTDALIKEALEEEEQRKKAKKGDVPASVKQKQRKGQTLREIEAEEGGPVKESMVGMAAVQRALRRKKTTADDDETGLPEDIEAYEEDEEHQRRQRGRLRGISEAVAAAMEGDGGFAMTGFNMRQEREEGHIDEEGNYISGKDDDESAQDAWLNSTEAQEASEKVKAAFAARQAAMTAAEEAPALSESAVAAAQRDIAALLLPGESVTAGLRRLGQARKGPAGGKALGKREKQRLAAQAAAGGDKGSQSADAAAAERDFTRLTELADLLLNAGGEMDIYSNKKEQLERWAAAVLPQTNILQGGDDDDDGDDMFASDDDKPANKPPTASSAADSTLHTSQSDGQQQQQQQQPPQHQQTVATSHAAAAEAASSAPAAAPASVSETVDYSSWPVRELRRYLTEHSVDSSSIVEKQELVDKVKAAAAAAAAAATSAPAGYSYDPSSGYFYSAENGMYWDRKTGAFYNSADSKWYMYDAAAGSFQLLEQQPAQQ